MVPGSFRYLYIIQGILLSGYLLFECHPYILAVTFAPNSVFQFFRPERLWIFYGSFNHPMRYCPQAIKPGNLLNAAPFFQVSIPIRISAFDRSVAPSSRFFSYFIPPAICRRVTLVGAYSIILEAKLDHLYDTDSFKHVKTCFMAQRIVNSCKFPMCIYKKFIFSNVHIWFYLCV